jgi:hypothetical protein
MKLWLMGSEELVAKQFKSMTQATRVDLAYINKFVPLVKVLMPHQLPGKTLNKTGTRGFSWLQGRVRIVRPFCADTVHSERGIVKAAGNLLVAAAMSMVGHDLIMTLTMANPGILGHTICEYH